MKAKMLEKEKILDTERNSLIEKEKELNRRIEAFNEEQKRLLAIKRKILILKLLKKKKD